MKKQKYFHLIINWYIKTCKYIKKKKRNFLNFKQRYSKVYNVIKLRNLLNLMLKMLASLMINSYSNDLELKQLSQ